jgi:S-adenosylmethionine synthetase
MMDCFGDDFRRMFEQPIRDLLRETGHDGSAFTVDPDRVEIRCSANVACYGFARGAWGEPEPDEPVSVYGYATDESAELMPLPSLLAHRLAARVSDARRSGKLPWRLPHARTKVRRRYARSRPPALEDVEVLVQHAPEIDYQALREGVYDAVLKPVLGEQVFLNGTRFSVNPAGSCVADGLLVKWGVSGRTSASDTYGPHCPPPCTGLSGRGTENLERSATLMARCLAKHVVAAGLARRCTTHLAYGSGAPEPEAVLVNTHGTRGRLRKSVSRRPCVACSR